MKYSKQSELIKNTMTDNKSHPTADMIYALLKPNNPSLSLATVYRNLNKLAENGEILKLTIPNSSDRFDSTTKQHYHMICSSCGCVTDCPIDILGNQSNIVHIEKEVYQNSQFRISSIQALIYGICSNCEHQ